MSVPRELWYLPRPARNHYVGGFPLYFEQRLFATYKPREILQPFGGGALYGLKCDINPEVKPDVVCDAHHLPFKDESFDFVLCDPPYSVDLSGRLYHTGIIKPKTYTSEAVRVCKTGGYVGLYHWVMPARPKGTRFDRIIVIICRVGHHARFCGVFQKVKTLFELPQDAGEIGSTLRYFGKLSTSKLSVNRLIYTWCNRGTTSNA